MHLAPAAQLAEQDAYAALLKEGWVFHTKEQYYSDFLDFFLTLFAHIGVGTDLGEQKLQQILRLLENFNLQGRGKEGGGGGVGIGIPLPTKQGGRRVQNRKWKERR